LQDPQKNYPNLDFWFEIYHLATLISLSLSLSVVYVNAGCAKRFLFLFSKLVRGLSLFKGDEKVSN
jgi:hypothetical protein